MTTPLPTTPVAIPLIPQDGGAAVSIPPGTRVAVDDWFGIVIAPTADDLAYAAEHYEGVSPDQGHVIVQFDGDEQDGDGGWYASDEVRVLP